MPCLSPAGSLPFGSTDLFPLVLLDLYLSGSTPATCCLHAEAQPRDHHGGLRLQLSCHPV